MRILIATDAFPPVCGGSGWSTYELARGLRARGHHLVIIQPRAGGAGHEYDGFRVIGFPISAPRVPFVRNYFRNELLYRRFAVELGQLIREHRIDVIHAQHELTGPPSVSAARATGIASICTIRDYWPLCYWSDLVRDPASGDLCPGCSAGAMTRCLPPRTGAAFPLAAAFIPYMRANLRNKQLAVAGADAIVAVSRRVAAYLRERSPDFAASRIEVIPNSVDIGRIRALVTASAPLVASPYAVFIGKLAQNKGVATLVDVVARARLAMPLVVIGDGPGRSALVEAASRARADIRLMKWLDRDDVFRWLGHAAFLIFPSSWPEPLSRVLLEASALSRPVAAMNTGGTPDVIVDEVTGLLSGSAVELAEDVERLASDDALRHRLGAAAGARAEQLFDVSVVVPQMERLYEDVVKLAHERRRGVA